MEGIQRGDFFLSKKNIHENKKDRKKVKKKSFFPSLMDSRTSSLEFHAGAVSPDAADVDLEKVLDEIHSIGDRLVKERTLAAIQEYKDTVRGFLQYVVKNSFTVDEYSSGKNILKRKKFALINVINKKLESLAAGVLQTQYSQFEILKKVDEINGFLVDILQ
jgi:hypothetical protein